ncbi:MAG: lysozyme inhibitor LprI family protein [Pseudomonadota bacterium]
MRLLLAAALCACMSHGTFAQENIDCGYPLNNNERTYCAEKALSEANTNLESVYKDLLARVIQMDDAVPQHLKGAAAALEEAQAAWVSFREIDCNAYSFPFKGGTRGNELYRNCMIIMTMQRIEDLQATLDDYGE